MKTVDFTVNYYHRETPIGDAVLKERNGVIKVKPNDTYVSVREKIGNQLCDLVLRESPESVEVEIHSVDFKLEEQRP